MKPFPPAADAHYMASRIVLELPLARWKDKIATLPEDKREAVREILKDYWTLAQNRRRKPSQDGYTGLAKAPKMKGKK